MNSRRIALFALASCLGLVSGLSAQTGHPRFYLPDKPFDYETVLAPPGRLHDRLRRWNGAGVGCHAGGAQRQNSSDRYTSG